MSSLRHVVDPSRRLTMPVAVLCLAVLVLGALPAGPAVAEDPTTTTSTEPAPDPTTTVPTSDPTTSTEPVSDPTSTTVAGTDPSTTTSPPSSTTTSPTDAGAAHDLSPQETLAPIAAFVSLTDGQRGVLQRLQTANDTFATRRVALVGLARLATAATDQLTAARAGENAAIEREIFGRIGAVLDGNHVTSRTRRTRATSRVEHPARAARRARAARAALDDRLTEVARRLDADYKTTRRARVQAEDRLAALQASVTAQTQAVTAAATDAAAAQSAAEDTFGASAVRAQADGITSVLVAEQAGQADPIVLGGLSLPIPGAVLESPFGIRIDPLGGGVGFHPGLDVEAGSGTPIHAAAAGVVVMAGDCGGYGSCVVVDHGSSLATVYAHQSQVLSEVGEQVDAGQVIGLVGSTGKSTGPHLHFELRLHGMPIDPVPALIP